jgi:hypothetical protein
MIKGNELLNPHSGIYLSTMYIMSKQLIIKDSFWQVFADPEAQLMEVYWLEQDKLRAEELKGYLEHWAKLVSELRPKGFLVDSRRGHVPMTPDIQAWHDTQIVPAYIAAGVKKVAFILPNDIFAALSIEQLFDEQESRKLETQFFDETESALAWLQE